MERQLLTWSIPNMITIWLMLLALFMVFTFGAQLFGGKFGKRGRVAADSSDAME
jgi:Na+-translocating ferredoxin:NAD+ oxidoreductase RnfD subunit